MLKSFENLKDNDIEILVLGYLLKHPNFLDSHFEYISPDLFANLENLNSELKNSELVKDVVKFLIQDKKRPICSPFSK